MGTVCCTLILNIHGRTHTEAEEPENRSFLLLFAALVSCQLNLFGKPVSRYTASIVAEYMHDKVMNMQVVHTDTCVDMC